MPEHLGWGMIAVRLALTLIAGESRVFTNDGKCCELRYQLRWHDDGRAAPQRR
ncbi:MAG: hypothetical protein JO007_04860 [Alphaproteobacteria bacterium]|nr:hypothetical protein [Alphaproteobacteria bacterium]